MDYVTRTLLLDVVLCTTGTQAPPRNETYRPALVTVKDVAYLVIEPPDFEVRTHGEYPWREPGEIRIDTGEGCLSPPHSTTVLPPPPVGTTANWLYLFDFNRFLFFAAGDSSLEWTDDEEIRA